MKEHRYIRRTHKYYTGIILIIVICTFIFLSKNIGYHKTSYKLHIRETRSGRPVIYLLDEISGSVEIINPNNVEYIKELKNKYDVVVKEWIMKLFEKVYESKLFDVSLMVVFIFTTALWVYKLIELIINFNWTK